MRDHKIAANGYAIYAVHYFTVNYPAVIRKLGNGLGNGAFNQIKYYAMLNILVLLLVDTSILGSLQGQAEGTGQTQFALLLGSTALKIFLTLLTFKHAGLASATAENSGWSPYLGNARGAKVATLICGLVSIAILVFGYKQAF